MTAPDRITVTFDNWRNPNAGAAYKNNAGETEYVRADLARVTLADALAVPEVAALVKGAGLLCASDYIDDFTTYYDALHATDAALRAIGEIGVYK